MSEGNNTIIESWPGLKDDLENFLSDTDAWIIAKLKEAHEARDWTVVTKTIDVMETVHNMAHTH